MSILIKDVRLSYPSLHKKTAFDEKDTPKFSAMFIMGKDHPQLSEVKALIKKTMMAKWSEQPAGLKVCLHDGKTKEGDGFGPSVMFFNANNEKRPGVYDSDRSVLTEDDGRPYAGCYVNARVSFWAMDNRWGKRVNAELNGVQFFADGEQFGGGGPPAQADDFPELEPQGTDEWDEEADAVEDDDWLD